VLRQHGNVRGAIAQRRHDDTEDVEAETKVGTEAAAGGFVLQVPVRCRDNPHVDAAGQILADSTHLAFLQHAQELRLSAGRELADFVEKERPAVGFFEESGAFACRAGEGPARMAEQLGLDELVAQRGAVDRAESARVT
jgi:hypothetical protein